MKFDKQQKINFISSQLALLLFTWRMWGKLLLVKQICVMEEGAYLSVGYKLTRIPPKGEYKENKTCFELKIKIRIGID